MLNNFTISSAFLRATEASVLTATKGALCSGFGRLRLMNVANCSNMVACESCASSCDVTCERSPRSMENKLKVAPPVPLPSQSAAS